MTRIDHGVGTVNITGINAGAGQVHGRRLLLLNVTVHTLVLQDDNAGSLAANRFLCPGNSGTDDFQFVTNGSVEAHVRRDFAALAGIIATSP